MLQYYNKNKKIRFDNLLGNKDKSGEIEEKFYQKTIKYLKFIKWIPGLRMIGIGNSVSMNSSNKNSDIDLFIVTTNNSLWLVRILITFIFSILGVRKNKRKHTGRFCLSFFATLDGLNFSSFVLKKDPYLYFWILYFKPILDYNGTYKKFLKVNSFWADFRNYNNIFEKNTKYIKYIGKYKDIGFFLRIINFVLKKIFLIKTLKNYKKIGKPFGVIINDNLLKFHNNDLRKKISREI